MLKFQIGDMVRSAKWPEAGPLKIKKREYTENVKGRIRLAYQCRHADGSYSWFQEDDLTAIPANAAEGG